MISGIVIVCVAMIVAILPAIVGRFIKSSVVKGLLSAASLVVFFIIGVIAALILPDFLGPNGVWLAFMLCGVTFVLCMLPCWKPFDAKTRRLVMLCTVGAAVLVTAVFAGPNIYSNSLPEAPGEDLNLYEYMPFGDPRIPNSADNTLAKSLDEPSTLKLEGDLPHLDGATALYPLYSAFVRATYPEGGYDPYDKEMSEESIVLCSRTSAAFESLIDGHADMVFLAGVSDEQRALAESRGLTLELTPVGREAFVFFVNRRNAMEGLSVEDIHRIYSGAVNNWSEVGGKNAEIRAYQRPDDSGSQTMLKQVMGDIPLIAAPQEDVYGTMMGLYTRVAGYKNYENSLGYSFLFYIRDMIGKNQVKFLSIDGVAPTQENIANGTYPFAYSFYAVTVRREGEYLNAERTGQIDRLLAWILSPQGQSLVEKTGYVALER